MLSFVSNSKSDLSESGLLFLRFRCLSIEIRVVLFFFILGRQTLRLSSSKLDAHSGTHSFVISRSEISFENGTEVTKEREN